MGNALRRFQAIQDENSVFKFTIDTSKINPSGTDGSENPLTFRIPCSTGGGNSAIIKVSDGRPDIVVNNLTNFSGLVLTFSSAGIYQVSVVGRLILFSFNGSTSGFQYGYDLRKIVSVDQWGKDIQFISRCFYGCVNLEINATNTLQLPADSQYFFRQIKGFNSPLGLIDTSKVTQPQGVLLDVNGVLPSTLNPFWQSANNLNSVYTGNTFDSSVDKIEIISNNITTMSDPWGDIVFQNTGIIRLICQTPNLQNIFRIHRNGQVRTRCHLGEVDVRNVTNTSGWANGGMAKALVDQTLMGWANNLPFMQSGVTWDWGGAKYSNNPAVIAAYNKITSDWGVIFTNLTME